MNYCAESTKFIEYAYYLLDTYKNDPQRFKPYICKNLYGDYRIILDKTDGKLSLCTATISDDVEYERIYTLTDNSNVPELLGVYISCLEQMEEDSKKNDNYCEAAIEFARQLDELIDIYNSQEPSDDHCTIPIWCGTTAYLLDGDHTLTIWHDGKISLCRVEENGGFRNRHEIGNTFIINKRVHVAPLLKKYLDSLRKHATEL